MSWVLAILLGAAMALTSVGATYFWLRLARLPSFVALVFSPAVTFALLVGLGYLYALLGIFWAGTTVLPALLAVGLLGAGLFWRVKKPASQRWIGGAASWGKTFWLMVFLGWLLAVLPMILTAPATNPVQQWDPSFHMNGVWSINHIGDGRMGSGLDSVFREGNSSDYPLGWHIFTALFTTPTTVVLGSNASTLALIALWVVGAGAYTRMLFGQTAASNVAPVLAGGTLAMPADAFMAYNQFPNATAVALLPGIATVMILLGRHLKDAVVGETRLSIPKLLGGTIGLALAIVGAMVVHPSVAFNLLVLLLPAVVAGLYRMFRVFIGSGRTLAAAGTAVTFIVGLAVIYTVLELPLVRSMGKYPRSGVSWALAFGNVISPTPPYPNSPSLIIWISVLGALLLLGIFVSYTKSSWWPQGKTLPTWPVWSFILFAGLVFLANGPNNALRTWLVAPWYLDARRVMEPQSLALVALAALGFAWACGWVMQWLKDAGRNPSPHLVTAGVLIAILLVTLGEGLPARTAAAATVYDPDRLGKPGMATAGELAMLESLDEILPEDAYVLGDPQNGSVYVQMIGQRPVFFPALTLSRNPTDNEKLLVHNFHEILVNPKICEAVREEGITHFYYDEDGHYFSRARSDRTPGLYNVDTGKGFELVAQGDTAKLYRISACD